MSAGQVCLLQPTIDRSIEADRVIQFLDGRRLAVLYGQRGSRRRELIRDWVIPRLQGKRLAYYADCEPELPVEATGPAGTLSIEGALRGGATVFLGRLERCALAPNTESQRRFAELIRKVEAEELDGSLVLSVSDRNLTHVFSLEAVAAELMANILEIRVVTFRESLQELAVHSSGLQYSPDALDELVKDSTGTAQADSVELAQAVDYGFSHFKGGSDRQVSLADCKAIGGIAGALGEYLRFRLEGAFDRFGANGKDMAEVVLIEVGSASKRGIAPDWDDITLRLGVGRPVVQDLIAWLRRDVRLLREGNNHQVEIVPAELSDVAEQNAALRQRDVARALTLLQDGARSWTKLQAYLPRKRVQEIEAVREFLPATDEEAAIMARSLLRLDRREELDSIPYWVGRIRSAATRTSVFLQGLFSDTPAVRARAAQFLAHSEESDVRQQLYRVATEDPEKDVRSAAVAALAHLRLDEELWRRISTEAVDASSPYQANAVAEILLDPSFKYMSNIFFCE